MHRSSQMEFYDDQESILWVSRWREEGNRMLTSQSNWLRDYSQAMDTGALKKASGESVRVLVWLLSFLGFGYATAEFEVTSERLGVYRPEEHIE